jgi:tetraacyldisaccharide 4'-kinase
VRALAPLGALYCGASALRAALYQRGVLRRTRLAGPVISVGNISVGGSGKTPVVARIAEMLRDEGLPVAILSRGYRGSFRGDALIVADGTSIQADAATAGDEPVMLARAVPGVVVAVGRRRDVVGRVVEARFGRRVHVLDDGFQHLRLARDLDVVCVSGEDLADSCLPAGRLRESTSALDRADVILATDGAGPGGPLAGRTHRAARLHDGFVDLGGTARPAPSRPFLVSGIARPERFAADVRALTGAVAGAVAFPDHHAFDAADVARVLAEARTAGADAVVTTAKDAVRLPAMAPALPTLVLRMRIEIADESRFRERVLAVARSAA